MKSRERCFRINEYFSLSLRSRLPEFSSVSSLGLSPSHPNLAVSLTDEEEILVRDTSSISQPTQDHNYDSKRRLMGNSSGGVNTRDFSQLLLGFSISPMQCHATGVGTAKFE